MVNTKFLDSAGLTYFYSLLESTLAPKNSPAFTGIPTAPTATAGANTTQIATTAFVQGEIGGKADIDSVLIPNFDNLTPLKTIEFDVSDTSYYQLFTRANTGISATMSEVNDVVMFRMTVRGSSIYGRADCVVRFRPGLTGPLMMINYDTSSTSAATTAVYYLRTHYPKTLNSGYPWVCDFNEYNATARHIKLEVFATTENITWVTGLTATTFNNTYQTSFDSLALYANRALFVGGTLRTNANTSTTAQSENAYHRMFFSNYSLKAGEALVANKLVYASEGKAWLISNKNYAIDPDICIGNPRTSISANTNIDTSYLGNQLAWIIATDTNLQMDTFAQYDKVYLRCNLVDGKIYSDAYLAKEITPGYTWYMLGVMYSATGCNLNTMGSFFITLDDSGLITHINGVPTQATALSGKGDAQNKLGNITSISDTKGSIERIEGRSLVWNQRARFDNPSGSGEGYTFTRDGSIMQKAQIVVNDDINSDTNVALSGFFLRSKNDGHKYLLLADGISSSTIVVRDSNNGKNYSSSLIISNTDFSQNINLLIRIKANCPQGTYDITISVFDLTQMFGTGREPATVEEFEKLFPLDYYDYNAGAMLSGTVTGFKSEDASGNTLTNISIPVTTMTGKQEGSSTSEVMFPYGLNGIRDVKDEIEFAGAKYEQLEYLETDGACAIATDLLLDGSEEWEIKFQSSKATLNAGVAGSLNGGSSYDANNNFSVTYVAAGAYAVYCNRTSVVAYTLGDRTDKLVHLIKWNGLGILPTLDGVNMNGTAYNTSITPSVPWTLFGRSATSINDRAYAQDGVRIFYFKGDGFNYIPCRRVSDGVLGFFDTVSEKFHTNVGTGTFRYGSIIGTISRTKARAVRRIGVVDLGTLSWTQQRNKQLELLHVFAATVGDKIELNGEGKSILACQHYCTIDRIGWGPANAEDKVIFEPATSALSQKVGISDSAYSDATTFATAMSGVMLYYELATPIEYTIDTVPATSYKTRKGGKEMWLPAHSSAPTAAPVDWAVSYGMNAVEEIQSLEDRIAALEAIILNN